MTARQDAIERRETSVELRGLALITHIACLGHARETAFDDRVVTSDKQMAASVVCVS